MSQVHDSIVRAALSMQADEVRAAFKPCMEDFLQSCWYPDQAPAIRESQPEEAHFLYPPPPKAAWQRRLERISRTHPLWTWCGQPPLPDLYLCRHYLRKAVGSLRRGDVRSAVKYCGVYSHVIADVIEPGHAVFDWALDIFTPVEVYASRLVLTNKECLRGPASPGNHVPRLLGDSLERAEMAAMNDLIAGSRFGAAMSVPMEQALYEGRIRDAREYSSRAGTESARKIADFIHTVFHLAAGGRTEPGGTCDLCALPYVLADMNCQCRFRPLVDVFMDPANFARPCRGPFLLKTRPLALRSATGDRNERVHGLCVKPPSPSVPASVQYVLAPGAYRRFSARVGLNPALADVPFLSARFSVRGDGRELTPGVTLRAGARPARIEAELGRTRFLSLEMAFCGGLSPAERKTLSRLTSAAHGVWGEPVLE